MHIIIASNRTPKIKGVKRAVQKITNIFGIDQTSFQFTSIKASSGVSDTPASINETMLGAKQRALAVFQQSDDSPVLSVGVEGGIFQSAGKVFLQSWSCVFDGAVIHFGSSGAIELPEKLAVDVAQNKIDLGIAIDSYSQQSDVRSHQGTFGILTKDLVSREDSFEMATIFALTPFFNTSIYK